MSINAFITKELLFAYFAGQATALQKQRIEDWVEDPANEEFFYQCVHEWEMKNPQYQADVNQGIEKFYQQISRLPGQVTDPVWEPSSCQEGHAAVPAPAPGKWPVWMAAASVVLLLGLSAWFFGEEILYKTCQTGYGQISTIALPDGSQVTLNANSQLVVPRFGFGRFSRKVFLKGEANFAVVHTPDHKNFIVFTDAPQFRVEVLGTEFNVFSRKRATKVGLYKGQVKVLYGPSAQQAQSMTMVPGDLITLDKSRQSLQLRKVPHPENFAAWQQGRFIFEHTPLSEIKAMLQENFGLAVELKGPGLAQQTVSGSFKASSVNELLEALAETLEMNVIRQDNQVVLTGRH